MADALRLFGLKTIVTDAASGIGEAIVRTFVKQGAAVLAVDSATAVSKPISESSTACTGLALDLRAKDSATQLIASAKSVLDGLDIVVCNFDLHGESPIADSDKAATESLTANMSSLISGVLDAAIPMLQKSPAGRMIAIGCLRSVFGKDGEQAYRASERALHALDAIAGDALRRVRDHRELHSAWRSHDAGEPPCFFQRPGAARPLHPHVCSETTRRTGRHCESGVVPGNG